MRRISVLITTVALALSGLALSPAQAGGGFDCLTNGSPTGTVTIEANVVTGNTNCAGEVNIPDGVTSIGLNAFYGNQQITSVTIPKSVTKIEVRGFSGCTSLAHVTFATGSKLKTIMASAFNSTYNLAAVEIPYGVTSVGDAAFRYAGTLTSVTFQGKAPTVGLEAFSDIGTTPTVHISYTATGFTLVADKWNGFIVVRDFEDQKVAANRVAHTLKIRTSYAAKVLATRVSTTRTSKAKVSLQVATASRRICKVSKGKLTTLKAGNCKVTIKIQEPKKKGKLPKAKKYKHTFVVQ